MPDLDGWSYTPAGLLVPQPQRPRYDKPVGIDLFAGCGGFSLGMHQAGFHMAAAVEYDENAALTYLINLARPGVQIHYDTEERAAKFERVLNRHFGIKNANGNAMSASAPRGQKGKLIHSGMLAGDGWIKNQPASERGCEHFWIADVRNLTGGMILAELGLQRDEVAVVVGGPPCQGFSMANSNRGPKDPRNDLVFEFARLVLEIRPKAMVMENVPQVATMLTPDGVPVIDALCRILEDGDFGAYSALRESLLSHPDARAAMRRDGAKGKKGRFRRAHEPEPDEPDDELATLFDLEMADG